MTYSEARKALYKDGFNKSFAFDSSYEESFVNAVKNATYGMFVYAKKYRSGYALKASDDTWFCVKALTTPLEEMIPEWCVIDTAVLPLLRTYRLRRGLKPAHIHWPGPKSDPNQDPETEKKKRKKRKKKN